MITLTKIAASLAVTAFLLSPVVVATPADAARMTMEQRTAYKAKRAECRAQAKAQKLHSRERSRFIRSCMKG